MTEPDDPLAAPARLPTLVHVPTPGDHYSPATGSGPSTVVYELSRLHTARGGRTRIVLGRGTRHDYPVGECVEVDFGPLPARRGKLVDAGLGRIGLRRRLVPAAYAPALPILDAGDGVAIVHNSVAAAAFFKSRRPRARVLLYAHNELLGSYGRREARRALESLDGIICVSEFLASRMLRAAPSANVSAVLNGVDAERFHPGEDGPDEAEPTILFVGRVQPYKGPHLLIAAALRLQAQGYGFRLRLVGSYGFDAGAPLSPYELELRALAAPLGPRVAFRPFVDRDKVAAEYRSASIFCAPAIWDDPCPLTVPEALASGLPTVAARRGGIPEVGGDAVLWFDPDDEESLVARLSLLLDSPDERRAWGRRARERGLSLAWANQYERFLAAVGG